MNEANSMFTGSKNYEEEQVCGYAGAALINQQFSESKAMPEAWDLYQMPGAPFHIPQRELHLRTTLEQQTVEMSRYSAGYTALRNGVSAVKNLTRGRTTNPDTFDVMLLLDAVQDRAEARASVAAEQVQESIRAQHSKEQEANLKWWHDEQRAAEQRKQWDRESEERATATPSMEECVQRCENDAADVLSGAVNTLE